MSGSHNHHDHHSHDGHSHSHDDTNKSILIFALIITSIFMVVEVFGGFISQSLALISDAGHMFADAGSLAISLWAVNYGTKKSNLSKTFGYKRIETIAAFINGITLIIIAAFIFKEGIERLFHPVTINNTQLILVASIGLVVNILVAFVLFKGSKNNTNIRGAFIHVIGDLLGSVGAILAGIIIKFTGWLYADPLISILIAFLILLSSLNLLKETFHTLMEGTPKDLDLEKICQRIKSFDNINDIHDLHVWSLNEKQIILTAHIIVNDDLASSTQLMVHKIKEALHHDFDINHSTLEVETVNCNINCN